MFGYVTINKAELKGREYEVYQSYYCGLCRVLKDKHGKASQISLSYDMTFLIVLLTGLYEPKTGIKNFKCVGHPLDKRPARINEITDYVSDMSIVMTYYKCQDDWLDDREYIKLAYSKLLKANYNNIKSKYTDKIENIERLLLELKKKEEENEADVDIMAGIFGRVMAEVFAYKGDLWEKNLRKIGFYLGKFVYLMDAYEDVEEDIEKDNYNPLLSDYKEVGFEDKCLKLLTMMMAECSKEFELLPIITNVEILRNILYSGVWSRYEAVRKKRQEEQVQVNE